MIAARTVLTSTVPMRDSMLDQRLHYLCYVLEFPKFLKVVQVGMTVCRQGKINLVRLGPCGVRPLAGAPSMTHGGRNTSPERPRD